jgi:hypothetical protein
VQLYYVGVGQLGEVFYLPDRVQGDAVFELGVELYLLDGDESRWVE